MVTPHDVEHEASRLLTLSPVLARQAYGDRVARTFLLDQPEQMAAFWKALDFNARLATELRIRAQARQQQTIWGTLA